MPDKPLSNEALGKDMQREKAYGQSMEDEAM